MGIPVQYAFVYIENFWKDPWEIVSLESTKGEQVFSGEEGEAARTDQCLNLYLVSFQL